MLSGAPWERAWGSPRALSPAAASGRAPHSTAAETLLCFRSRTELCRYKPSCLVAEVSGTEIQVRGRGAARGVLHPLRLVPGVQLGRRPVLEPAGHPAVHDGLRLSSPPAPPPGAFSFFLSGEQTWETAGVSPLEHREQACFPRTLGSGAPVPVGRSRGFGYSTKRGRGPQQ